MFSSRKAPGQPWHVYFKTMAMRNDIIVPSSSSSSSSSSKQQAQPLTTVQCFSHRPQRSEKGHCFVATGGNGVQKNGQACSLVMLNGMAPNLQEKKKKKKHKEGPKKKFSGVELFKVHTCILSDEKTEDVFLVLFLTHRIHIRYIYLR